MNMAFESDTIAHRDLVFRRTHSLRNGRTVKTRITGVTRIDHRKRVARMERIRKRPLPVWRRPNNRRFGSER